MNDYIITGAVAVGKSTALKELKKLLAHENYKFVDELDFNDQLITKMIEETYNDNCCSMTSQFHVFHDRLTKFILKNEKENYIFDRGPIDPYIFNKILNNYNSTSDFYYSIILENLWRFKNVTHIIFELNLFENANRFNNRKRENERVSSAADNIIKNFYDSMIAVLNDLNIKYIKLNIDNLNPQEIARKLYKIIKGEY